jgi:hypothetical protein
MLNEVNSLIYEMESIYLKELNQNIVLDFMEKFYNNFLRNNQNVEGNLLQKTANVIIICMDTIILKKSVIKDKWIYKTGENYILNQNRGGETFDKLVKDIIDGYVPNRDVIRIVQMFFTLEVESEYKNAFLEFLKDKPLNEMNINNNLMISSLNKLKAPAYRYMYMACSLTLISLFFSQLYYFINLKSELKIMETLLNNIRSLYVI